MDNGQHKKAIQLADKMLKKQEELQCARVKPLIGDIGLRKCSYNYGLSQRR